MAIEAAILEEIKKYQTIIIHRHQRPDPDCIGAQLALRDILQASFQKRRFWLWVSITPASTGWAKPTKTWKMAFIRAR